MVPIEIHPPRGWGEAMSVHQLKVWPQFYPALVDGSKTFEVRKNDRGYQVGDLLVLQEWDPATDAYTGRSTLRHVTYMLAGGAFGLPAELCVLGLRPDVEVQPIDTAPTDGTPFFAYQDGEVYVGRILDDRMSFRTHSLFVGEKHEIIDAVLDGKPVKARVPIDEPWAEHFDHSWTLWTRGFEFNPTGWSPIPVGVVHA
jgi:hypothetical protein